MDYYSARKKNEIVPLAAVWMDIEIIMLSEISQRKTNTTFKCGIFFKKMQINLYAKTETDSQKTNCQRGNGSDKLGVWA